MLYLPTNWEVLSTSLYDCTKYQVLGPPTNGWMEQYWSCHPRCSEGAHCTNQVPTLPTSSAEQYWKAHTSVPKHQVLWQPTKQLNWARSMVEFLMSSAHAGVVIKLARISFSIGMCGNWISPMIPSIGTILSHNILLLPVNIANSIMTFTRKFILPCEKDIDLRIVSAFLELSTLRRWPRFSLSWMSQFFWIVSFLGE